MDKNNVLSAVSMMGKFSYHFWLTFLLKRSSLTTKYLPCSKQSYCASGVAEFVEARNALWQTVAKACVMMLQLLVLHRFNSHILYTWFWGIFIVFQIHAVWYCIIINTKSFINLVLCHFNQCLIHNFSFYGILVRFESILHYLRKTNFHYKLLPCFRLQHCCH